MCDSDEIHSDEFIFGAQSGGAEERMEEGRRKDGVLGEAVCGGSVSLLVGRMPLQV